MGTFTRCRLLLSFQTNTSAALSATASTCVLQVRMPRQNVIQIGRCQSTSCVSLWCVSPCRYCSFFAVASRTRQQWTKQLGKSRAQDVIVGYANLVLGLIGFCLYWTDKRIIVCCHFRLSTGEGGCLCKSGQTTSLHDDRSATLDGTRSKSSGLFAMLQHRANDVQINALCLLLFDKS